MILALTFLISGILDKSPESLSSLPSLGHNLLQDDNWYFSEGNHPQSVPQGEIPHENFLIKLDWYLGTN